MKVKLFILLLLFNLLFPQSYKDKYKNEGYKLVWSDEFDGETLNDKNWWAQDGEWERDAESFWKKDNVKVKKGILELSVNIDAKHELNKFYDINSINSNFKKKYIDFTSASIVSKNRKEWMYGRFVIRAKFDIDKGMWPSFWTIGKNIDVVGWPLCGEIDIMEYFNNFVMSNLIYSALTETAKPVYNSKYLDLKLIKNKVKWSNTFHEWIMDWEKEKIILSLDGKVINSINLNELTDNKGYNPFRQPHYFFLELRGGGNNAGKLDINSRFPKKFIIDYIRVYQKQ